jgi:hypothetical protein
LDQSLCLQDKATVYQIHHEIRNHVKPDMKRAYRLKKNARREARKNDPSGARDLILTRASND